MTKSELKKLIADYEDAIITYRSLNSNKLKYNVCTATLNTKYISTKTNKAKEDSDTLLLFCWDTDSFRLIRPQQVVSVVPLDKVLRSVDGTL